MSQLTRDEHLFGPGAKRILALDGGGIRGILSIQILRQIETLLRARQPVAAHADFRLSDYFDLIGGTSTGAIIATGLALGMRVDDLDALYRKLGADVFDQSLFRKGLMRAKFSKKPLRAALASAFGNATLGGPELRTGLAIVTKRIDTGSPWVLHNNPRGRHYSERDDDGSAANADYLLRDLVRASTAAPHYFDPERVTVAKGTAGAFVDGGVSPHNNPSLQLLMLASLKGYGLDWPLGADRLLLVSVGTGGKSRARDAAKILRGNPVALAVDALASVMDDAAALNETLLQWFSQSPTARTIDGEVGDLRADVFGGSKPWLSYVRYDVELERRWLAQRLQLTLTDAQLEGIEKMDEPKHLGRLALIGEAAAKRLLQEPHFPAAFDR
ncbi:MAG TPA: patatin-like phospholipase family protein [Candidatus Saccharimonadia bacterium]|nr:patatin-like phospholipase family protein [Candidatus Saccharimonadia bacterium]